MKKLFFFIALSIFFSATLIQAQDRCGSMDYLQMQLQQNPAQAQTMQAIEQQTQQFLANPDNLNGRAIITIPVVVHVVYNTTAQNISTAQIQSQIDRLNLDYHKLNTDISSVPSVWQSLVADYQIQFCLASRDPNGNTTTGIIRKQTSTTSFSTNDNVKHNSTGGDDAWPAASYLNLWVCNLGGGLLGYAQFPGGTAATDGVVITYTGFGTNGTATAPYDLGRTATHEVGHWLNLYHIWGDDGSACTGSDQVSDTPNQGSEHYGCPNFPTVSCSNGPNGDMFMNYMDYTDDACMYMFTNGQYARSSALFASGGARYSLVSSLGCTAVTQVPVANFSANTTSSCTGDIQFTDLSTGSPTSWLWSFGDGTTSTLQNPAHTYTTNGTFSVTLTATNTYGSNPKTISNYITINKPNAPAVTGGSRCGTGTVILSSTSTDTLKWYSSATATTPIGTGNPFTTPSISTTTTFYAEASVTGTAYHVGKADNSGGGGYLNSSWYLIFNVLQPCTLKSVYVYAQAAGNRTFELQNSGGTVIATTTVNVPAGGSRVTLNFALSPGSGYKLGFPSGSTVNLYRNNATVAFPYNDTGGYISITGNTANDATRYYYCYDWIITGQDCVSQRIPVTATVTAGITLSSVNTTNINCFGNANGAASITATGGTPAYTYTWSSGQTTSSVANLVPGNYSVTVNDAGSCSASASATITQPSAALNVSVTPTNVLCNGSSTGALNTNATGGTTTYSYNWGGGITTPNRTNIPAGTYTVTVTDANSCTATATATVTQPTALNVTTTANNAGCGANNGSASVNVSGGSSPYTYSWSTGATTTAINNLGAGAYPVTVTDNHSCTATAAALVNSSGSLNAGTTATAINCNGGTNGSASVSVTSGTQPYSYLWSNGSTSSSINNLTAGSYIVTITDGNNCSLILSQTVTQPAALSGTVSTTPAGCGASNGSASVAAAGGTSGYTYQWSSGGTTASVSNLAAGTYVVTVTDSHNCTASVSGAVTSSGNLSVSVSSTAVTCNGYNSGSATATVNSGTAPYTYLWSNGGTTSSVGNLTAGNYSVTINDNSGCQNIENVTVTEPAQLNVSVTTTNITCGGSNNGTATATVTGGTAGYAYTWTTGATISSISNLSAGTYSVTVDDANHCSTSATFTITDQPALNLNVTGSNLQCYNDNSGAVNVNVTGGTPAYNYSWNNGSSASFITGLSAGTYTVTVTDGHNCSGTATAIITSPAQIQFATSTVNSNQGQNNGIVSVSNVTGGNAPYTYEWSNGVTTAVDSNLAPGVYSVTVSDNNGCQAYAFVVVSEISGISNVNHSIAFTVYPNPASHQVTVSVQELNSETTMSIKNVLGQSLQQISIVSSITNIQLGNLASGVYFVELHNKNGKAVKQLIIE